MKLLARLRWAWRVLRHGPPRIWTNDPYRPCRLSNFALTNIQVIIPDGQSEVTDCAFLRSGIKIVPLDDFLGCAEHEDPPPTCAIDLRGGARAPEVEL